MPFNWFAVDPRKLASDMEAGPGSGATLRPTAALFRQLNETFETLASEVDSLLAQLQSVWSSEAADSAAQVFRRTSTGLREMGAVADTVSQQADVQADANDSARSSMPTLQEILDVLAAIAAARASQNYGLLAALMALYRVLSNRASSTMQGYEAASLPNTESPSTDPTSSLTNPSSGASGMPQLMESLGGAGLSSPPTDLTDELSELTSPILRGLSGGVFGSGGDGFNDLGNIATMTTGLAAAMPGILAGFQMPQSPSMANTAVPATSPGPAGAPVAPMGGAAARRRDEKDRKVEQLPGSIVASEDEAPPDLVALGVLGNHDADFDDLAAADGQPA